MDWLVLEACGRDTAILILHNLCLWWMNLESYGGVNEIGGNRFLLDAAGRKLWLDMGASFHSGLNEEVQL